MTHLQARMGEPSLLQHYQEVYRPDAQGYQEMTAALGDISAYAGQHGIRLYLAIVPDIHDLEHYQLGFAHQQVAALAERLGYRTIDLLPAFGKRPPQDVWAMPGDPHPNALGQAIMADAMAPLLYAPFEVNR